jgi:hypothetical protein
VKPLDEAERQIAEAAARVIAKAEEVGLPDAPTALGVTQRAFRSLARAYVELRDQVRALHDLVDQTDPNDPVGAALTKVGLERRPRDWNATGPRLVPAPAKAENLSPDQLLKLYCRVMRETEDVFVKYENYIVRVWDGMDGCWTDCTGEVGREEALRYWAKETDGGTRRIGYSEIDYYRIFPGGTRMMWDGSEGREMHR